mmetsp:Transcript_31489/g.100379  ORF Transcript_31489/g.100379 Transcript_31489/m.100379 type:complete len:244 (+) Transcript_31489:522-1253(+)
MLGGHQRVAARHQRRASLPVARADARLGAALPAGRGHHGDARRDVVQQAQRPPLAHLRLAVLPAAHQGDARVGTRRILASAGLHRGRRAHDRRLRGGPRDPRRARAGFARPRNLLVGRLPQRHAAPLPDARPHVGRGVRAARGALRRGCLPLPGRVHAHRRRRGGLCVLEQQRDGRLVHAAPRDRARRRRLQGAHREVHRKAHGARRKVGQDGGGVAGGDGPLRPDGRQPHAAQRASAVRHGG